jgi:hypothetical protein
MATYPEIETADDLAATCRRYLLDAFPALRLIDPAELERMAADPDKTALLELMGLNTPGTTD